jgi:hypothetical protein
MKIDEYDIFIKSHSKSSSPLGGVELYTRNLAKLTNKKILEFYYFNSINEPKP